MGQIFRIFFSFFRLFLMDCHLILALFPFLASREADFFLHPSHTPSTWVWAELIQVFERLIESYALVYLMGPSVDRVTDRDPPVNWLLGNYSTKSGLCAFFLLNRWVFWNKKFSLPTTPQLEMENWCKMRDTDIFLAYSSWKWLLQKFQMVHISRSSVQKKFFPPTVAGSAGKAF